MIILLRGLPGAGKTTLSNEFDCPCFSADDYFTDADGNYNFDPSRIAAAHGYCLANVRDELYKSNRVCVANTFTQQWEMQPYFDLAEEFGVPIHCVIVENRHESESIHDVPEVAIEKMRDRFEVNL